MSTLKEAGTLFRTARFLESAANDEKILDAPGVDIPTISITRYPYPEYHTSDDNAALIDPVLLNESCALLRTLFDRIEADYVRRRRRARPTSCGGRALTSASPVWVGAVIRSAEVSPDHGLVALDLRRAALAEYCPDIHHHHAIRDRRYQRHVVFDHDHRDAEFAAEAGNPVRHQFGFLVVEALGGFIQQHDPWRQ